MKDSRPLLGILLIMMIAIVPGFIWKRPPRTPAAVVDSSVAGPGTGQAAAPGTRPGGMQTDSLPPAAIVQGDSLAVDSMATPLAAPMVDDHLG